MPILQGALICDAAHEYNGLVSVLGGFVNVINAGELPTLAPIWYAARVGFWANEIDIDHEVVVRAEGPDGETLAEVRGQMTRIGQVPTIVAPELTLGVNLVFPLPFPIVREGMYWIELRVDGEQAISRLPIKVILNRPPAP